ncbi:hypothetical protein HY249_02815 [Candidatus Azambacteria bacterium]|nr:hypothetical protein [Candidatus Azambacteria bacterium]
MKEYLSEEDMKVDAKNRMQVLLAEESGMDTMEWIAKNAKSFDEVIQEHPEYLSDFLDKPAETIQEIKNTLH